MNILYISYDGMSESLGRSQVVNYLCHLARTHAVTLLSYEKPQDLADAAALRGLAEHLGSLGVRWIRLRYHKRPSLLATGWDVCRGLVVGLVVCWVRRIRLIHARSYVPSVIAFWLKRVCGVKVLFDMRGFWVEEKVEAGHWRRGSFVYRLAKRWERQFFEHADAIVSLTAEGIEAFPTLGYAIRPSTPVVVIPTCADLTHFFPAPKDPRLVEQLQLHNRLVVGGIGDLSNRYLRSGMLAYYAFLSRRLHRVTILLVTQEDHAQLLRDALAAGLLPESLSLTRADFLAMPAYLRLMDLGVIFRKAQFSNKGSLPVKLGELLATGVPVVINEGVADAQANIQRHEVGVVLAGITEEDFAGSLGQVQRLLVDPSVKERCRAAAQECFNLEYGVAQYLELYHRLEWGPSVQGLEGVDPHILPDEKRPPEVVGKSWVV